MFPAFRRIALLALGVMIVAAAVWAVGERQRVRVDHSAEQVEGAHEMLTGMLDQETALRGYAQTDDETFLEPYSTGQQLFSAAIRRVRTNGANLDAATHALIDHSERLAREWGQSADEAIFRIRMGRKTITHGEALARKAQMDEFRATNDDLVARIGTTRRAEMRADQRLAVGLIVTLATLFGAGAWAFIGRPAELERAMRRAEGRRRDLQSEFARTMQVVDGEQGAHVIVKRHLERALPPETRVVVLQRNNSADRLDATTPIRHQPLAEAVRDATPASCLAVRLGTQHQQQTSGGDALLECELCGKAPTELTTCTPLVVSGEVIGSVLVEHDVPLGRSGAAVVDDTVTQAAPVLANMRNLAIAESRASTDALTGLANRRSVQDTIRRMVAHAARTGSPMAVLAIDIDHFKRINDRYGHDKGDDVLAAVGQTLTGAVRASDFVGRQGGEEFVALLPDTDLSGALVVAENLRASIAATEGLGIAEGVTASVGVAIMPEDGNDPATLLRLADRALYAAKASGRNRVETAASDSAQVVFADDPSAG